MPQVVINNSDKELDAKMEMNMKNDVEVANFSHIIKEAARPSKTQEDFLVQVSSLLETGAVGDILVKLCATNDSLLISSVLHEYVKLPDRVSNLVGLNSSQLPQALYPSKFCSLTLKNLAMGLLLITNQGLYKANSQPFSILLAKMFLNFKDSMNANAKSFWTYLSAWTSESTENAEFCQSLFSNLDISSTEKCLLSALDSISNQQHLHNIFGSSISGKKLQMLQRNLFLVGLRGGVVGLGRLLGLVRLSHPDQLPGLLLAGLKLWVDPHQVDGAAQLEQERLARTICLTLAWMTRDQLAQARTKSVALVAGGVAAWLEASRTRRELGMCVVTVILERFGEDKLPQWEIQNVELLDELKELAKEASGDCCKMDIKAEDVLRKWEVVESYAIVQHKDKAKQEKVQKDYENEENRTLDSDDDEDDDDLPAFDMSGDVKQTEGNVDFYYIRDIITELANPESDHGEKCFKTIPILNRKHLLHEDASLVGELLKVVLYSHNKFESKNWVDLRQAALVSITETRPVPAAGFLVPAFYDKNNGLDAKFALVDTLTQAGLVLAGVGTPENGVAPKLDMAHKDFGEFLKVVVGGLCLGAGQGEWGRLDVSGADGALVCHLVVSMARLVQVGCNQPGWEGVAAAYLELVLGVAGGASSSVRAACLHGVTAVVTLVKPHHLNGSLGQLLGAAARWAGQLEGDLGQAGQAAVLMLTYKHEQAVQEEINKPVDGGLEAIKAGTRRIRLL